LVAPFLRAREFFYLDGITVASIFDARLDEHGTRQDAE
jgi:hypothetical protein